jgi:hypothetical protein
MDIYMDPWAGTATPPAEALEGKDHRGKQSGYILSISQQGVSADIIQKVCLLVVSLVAIILPPPPLCVQYSLYSLSRN